MTRKKRLLILGHRGYAALYPENTVKSMRKAFTAGADGVEFDVQKTPAGFIVFHDVTLLRMMGIDVHISRLTSGRLRRYNLKGKVKIALLKHYLESIPAGKLINVELKKFSIKTRDFEAIDAILSASGRKKDIIVSSFKHKLLRRYRESGYRIGYLYGKEHALKWKISLLAELIFYRPYSMNIPIRFMKERTILKKLLLLFISRCIKTKLIFWTVNTRDEFDLVSSMAYAVITDNVALGNEFRNGTHTL